MPVLFTKDSKRTAASLIVYGIQLTSRFTIAYQIVSRSVTSIKQFADVAWQACDGLRFDIGSNEGNARWLRLDTMSCSDVGALGQVFPSRR